LEFVENIKGTSRMSFAYVISTFAAYWRFLNILKWIDTMPAAPEMYGWLRSDPFFDTLPRMIHYFCRSLSACSRFLQSGSSAGRSSL